MQRALLVGINAYPAPYPQLRGCVNDIMDMADFLTTSAGFSSSDLRLVTDERATAAAIREQLNWLVSGLRSGDRAVFHYSGHGVVMTGGDAGSTTVHDAIAPVDFDWTPAHAIRDTDFSSIFGSLPDGVELVWVNDACHAGDLTRAVLPQNAIPKCIFPPADIAFRIHTLIDPVDDSAVRGIKRSSIREVAAYLNLALLAACQSDETASDAVFGSRANGAFTYALLQELKLPQGLTETLAACMADVSRSLAPRFPQHPELRGAPVHGTRPFLGAAPRSRAIDGEWVPFDDPNFDRFRGIGVDELRAQVTLPPEMMGAAEDVLRTFFVEDVFPQVVAGRNTVLSAIPPAPVAARGCEFSLGADTHGNVGVHVSCGIGG